MRKVMRQFLTEDKTLAEILAHYSWIPKIAVEIYLKYCIPCQHRKPVKTPVLSKPILSLGVLTRLQIDLIDMRTRPNCISSDVVYQWILHCKDHYSKYSWAYSLVDKSADGVAKKLRELFFTFGPPKLLHSDNGAQFVADVITALKLLFPDMCFIRGGPRHPQSQGLVERGNGVLCNSLGKWMSSTNSEHWSDGLLPVVMACKFGKLAIAHTVESLIDLRSACSSDLKLNEVNSLGEITVIEAAKLLVHGAVSSAICDCKTKCGTKHCPCRKVGVACSTKCHVKQRECLNST
ncbi:unnamed protein product [Didymodactylos carnosus]|uniref:Integrase catalytic domain-containing protein n=1 Tax=Didymodactylos carnosus TaxID=1234261 RepID=A0A813SYW6_9BILA|nr:unnamed protein product [Didymodactylos carnosus]CAF3592043.1 unnamed protein product [Didymodactylos carnosus]